MEARFIVVRAWTAVFAVAASACATRPAPDFGGGWQPVNRYDVAARPVPLRPAHRFHALPTDRTLRNLLVRWASESQRRLSYRHVDDYTLHAAVAQVDSERIESASAQLAQAYAAYDLDIRVTRDEIVVRPAARAVSSEPMGVAGPAESGRPDTTATGG